MTARGGSGAAIVGVALVVAACGAKGDTAADRTKPTTTSPSPVPSGSSRIIGAAPGRADGAPAWTGEDLVLWSGGGHELVDDGIAYRPATDTWRTLAPSPLGARSSHTSVWTGKEIVYWGGKDARNKALGDGAAYDPAANSWRKLPAAPIPARFGHEASWTGREMVVWGGMEECCPIDSTIHDVDAAAYDPATNRWRNLADVPPPWSGDDGRAITGAGPDRMAVWREDRLGLLDVPANRWRDLGSYPSAEHSGSQCMVTGGPISVGAFTADRLVVWTGGCQAEVGYAYDLATNQWSRLGPAPAEGLDLVVAMPAVFGLSSEANPRLMRYDEARRTWADTSAPRGHVGRRPANLWTGTHLLLWGGYRDDGTAVRTGLLHTP